MYKNPISSISSVGTPYVPNYSNFGTHFSIYGVGGFMEVYNLSDLYYTIPPGQYGTINYSGNSIPLNYIKSSGGSSFDTLVLNSDNISSGRRKLGMLVYVYETDQIYQFLIDNYSSLWSSATASTNCVTIGTFGTTVRGNTSQGLAFINAWTENTIEGVSGETSSTAVWKKLVTGGGGGGSGITGGTYYPNTLILDLISTGGTISINNVTGLYISAGTYTSGTSTLNLFNSTGGTISITGITAGSGGGGGVTSLTTGTGLSGNTTTGSVTIINTAPDQTVTISGGTGITTGGTYPNFTITNSAPDQTVTITGGTNIQIVSSYPNFGVNFTGSTSGSYLPLSGGTVTGATIFQSGLTANTIYTNYIDFNTSSTPVNNEGRLIWNNSDEIGGLEVTMMSGNTVLQIGEENLARVYNADSVTLTAGTVVYVFGNQGNTISVKRATNTGETTSSRVLGVVSEPIAVGDRGFVNTFGLVRNLDTSSYSGGTPIWLGTTPGSWTSTEPDAPNHTVLIGFVSRVSPTVGSIFIHISNGWELNELHNVYAPSPSDGNILKYSASTSVWVNSNTLNLNGISASTISATTYQNLPTDVRTTGGTYSSGTLTLGNSTGGTVTVTGFPATTSFGVTVDGSGGVITTGQKGYVRIPYDYTITSWTLIGSPSGSITFDIWKRAGAIPTVANTIITGGTKPSLSTATYATSSTLTGWNITGATGDVIGWNVDSCTTTTIATLQLFVTRTQ